MSKADLMSLVGSTRVEMVGISVSNSHLLDPLCRFVAAIKQASLNPELVIMVGGSLALAGHAAEIGAAFCNDPRDAVLWLERHARLGSASRTN
jgi:methyl coenzyme M reductase subunit C